MLAALDAPALRPSAAVLSLLALGVGCGGADAGSTSTRRVEVSFAVSKDGANVPCSQVPDITELEVVVRAAGGATVRAGYPRDADCAAGVVLLDGLPDGAHELELSARGVLAGDERALLFRATTTFETPRDTSLSVSLRPEVAFLEVAWTFEGNDLLPCELEVGDIEVLVSAGSSQGASFTDHFSCAATPVRVPAPLPLLAYTIQVNAYSAEGYILFSGTANRAVERGENRVELTLAAMGGRLYLDWLFGLGGEMVRLCDDPRVAVETVVARVRTVEGGANHASTELDCAAERPVAFAPRRYQPGRLLEVELVAEGAERFLARETFVMPAGDRYQDPPIVLGPVGTATASVVVRTSTCSELLADGIELAVYREGTTRDPVAEARLPAGRDQAVFADLPFGAYEVDVSLARGPDRLCTVRERRAVGARWTLWDPFVL